MLVFKESIKIRTPFNGLLLESITVPFTSLNSLFLFWALVENRKVKKNAVIKKRYLDFIELLYASM
jgi:hypothetical protein